MNKLKGLEAKLGEPNLVVFDQFEFGDKGVNIQLEGLTADMRGAVHHVLRKDNTHSDSHFFFQGDAGDNVRGHWMMIEFWTKDKASIRLACEAIAKAVGVTPAEIHDFERVLPAEAA